MEKIVYVNCDGASRGNPGLASIGALIKGEDKKKVLLRLSKFIGKATNNYAEYFAIIESLRGAKRFTNKTVFIFSDSELLVKQLKGIYKVKSENLKPLYEKIKLLEKSFEEVRYFHVRRELNSEADALANKALDDL